MLAVARRRSRREEPPLSSDEIALRGLLGPGEFDVTDLRMNAETNILLYGFPAISVWVPSEMYSRERLERTKLVKFDRYATFRVGNLYERDLALWATGQSPHYDVVHRDQDVDALIDLVATTSHEVCLNPHVDREEH